MNNFLTKLIPSQRSGILFRARLIGLVLLLSLPTLFAASSVEQKIKVAYIYNFTKFITWPDHQGDTFNLCVLGEDPFGLLFKSLESKTALGLPIKLVKLKKFDPSMRCHILFLGNKSGTNVIQSNINSGILTVSEMTQFVKIGGIIGFVVRNGRVKLQINIDQAKLAGLVISAKLLEIAELVEGGGDG